MKASARGPFTRSSSASMSRSSSRSSFGTTRGSLTNSLPRTRSVSCRAPSPLRASFRPGIADPVTNGGIGRLDAEAIGHEGRGIVPAHGGRTLSGAEGMDLSSGGASASPRAGGRGFQRIEATASFIFCPIYLSAFIFGRPLYWPEYLGVLYQFAIEPYA